MKQLSEVLNQPNVKVLIVGGECSGKTETLKMLVDSIVSDHNVFVLSNHDEIYSSSLFKENILFFHKSKDIATVPVNIINKDSEFIFIDEPCNNYREILKAFDDKSVIIVKTVNMSNFKADFYKNDFNYILISEKGNDEDHTTKVKRIIEL